MFPCQRLKGDGKINVDLALQHGLSHPNPVHCHQRAPGAAGSPCFTTLPSSQPPPEPSVHVPRTQGAAGSQSSSNAPAMRLLCISAAMWLPAGQQETKVRAVLAELLGLLFSTLVAGQMHNKCLFPSTVRAARDTRLAGHHT